MATRRERPAEAADPVVLDLRESTDDLTVTSDDPLLVAADLVAVLDDGDPADGRLLLALVDAATAQCSIAALVSTKDRRVLRWSRILDEVLRLERPSAYIGTFRKTTDEVARIAANLPDDDRTVAAMFLLDRTAALATNRPDFTHGVSAAMRTQPSAIVPASVIDTLVRTCLRYQHAEPRRPAIAYGLPIALDILATSRTACLSEQDVWGIRAALAQLEPEERDAVLERASSLNRDDRRIIESVLSPVPTSRFGRRRRRDR